MNKQLKLMLIMMIMMMSSLLIACQSQPTKTTTSKTSQQRHVQNTPSTTTQITTREVPVVRSKDGVQDIRWTVSQIKFKKALFFNQVPFLQLISAQQRVQAHTGCNPIFGSYKMDSAQKTLSFDVKAAHTSCDNALSQEADLMDALARTAYFQINGRRFELLDQKRQVLIQLEQR